ncbi:SH2 domain-containing protein 2A [Triplophysa tibetana]|uniref:SH2 domain-containing protein 2A n=1 Tax=Triplophysa tibetana TaxID=1572043 RepID=A0A5A9NJI6_9TELE|nr:SH2 domain-containing protein 2A [Triplophysa tibetana]
MDFDYQKLKDAESQHREERLGSLNVLHPRPKPRQCLDSEMQVTTQKPPVKPRRSLKGRPIAQQETDPLKKHGQQKANEVTVKRMNPALVLGTLGTLEPLSPSLRAHTLLWFERTQLPRLRTPGHSLPRWLHGFATRREAEQLLQDKPQGCFLLRLSESKIGFALSYRGEDRCRHFIIEEEDSGTFGGLYLIAGEDSRHHSLEDLVNYYTHNPVGPFHEMLTVPCIQPNGDREEIDKLGRKNQEGDRKYENGKEISQDEETKLPIAAGPAVHDSLPTSSNQVTSTRDETVQYAAVRKPLKKTASLPECNCGPDTAPPTVENGISEFAERPYNPSVTLDPSHPPEPQYARVNKPPRVASENTPNANVPSELQGATAASVPPSLPNLDTTAADQKYCKLEPIHTYEETIHTRRRDEDEEIDCYAMGWRRNATGNAVELPRNHVYSEVNIRGAQESHSVSSRPTPSLPLRPPPRSVHAALRAEGSGQSFDLPPLMVQPHHSHDASSSSIYERIPERPTSSRPSLPPPNHKR